MQAAVFRGSIVSRWVPALSSRIWALQRFSACPRCTWWWVHVSTAHNWAAAPACPSSGLSFSLNHSNLCRYWNIPLKNRARLLVACPLNQSALVSLSYSHAEMQRLKQWVLQSCFPQVPFVFSPHCLSLCSNTRNTYLSDVMSLISSPKKILPSALHPLSISLFLILCHPFFFAAEWNFPSTASAAVLIVTPERMTGWGKAEGRVNAAYGHQEQKARCKCMTQTKTERAVDVLLDTRASNIQTIW